MRTLRNDSAMAPEWVSEKTLKLLKYGHIIYYFKDARVHAPIT